MTWGEDEARLRIRRAIRRGKTSLWLKDLQLTQVPEELREIEGLRKLYLQQNQLEQLPSWMAERSSLEVLHLDDNDLTELPDWIGGLTELRSLRLHRNFLTGLPDSVTGLRQLAVLGITGTDIARLPDWIAGLHALGALYIGDLQLGELPDWLPSLPRLTALDVSRNWLTDLPPWFGDMRRLERVEASANHFDRVPAVLRHLGRLTALDLSGNQLRGLPDWIGELTSLRSLNVQANDLRALPEVVGNLTALRSLNVQANALKELPNTIPHLHRLTALAIGGNELKAVPAWTAQLARLRSLKIDGCSLAELPESLRALKRLNLLHAQGNQLATVPAWLGEFSRLRDLALGSNQLAEFPSCITRCRDLRRLILDDNVLTEIPGSISSLDKLITLSCAGSRLESLPAAMARLRRLEQLWLQSVGLTTVPDWVAELPRLQLLALSANPITEVPATLRGHARIRALYFENSSLAEMPAWIGDLPSLTGLGVGSGLAEVPAWVRSLRGLQVLWLNKLDLDELPDWIGELTQLRTLSFYSSPIDTLPDSIANLRKLMHFNAYETGLRELPQWIGGLTRLQSLFAGGSELARLPASIRSLRRLENLELASNKLEVLPDEVDSLRSLRNLRVDDNLISEVPPGLSRLYLLKSLSLSGNQLTAVPPAVLDLRLHKLGLDRNAIRTLDDRLLDMPYLKELDVHSNPLISPPPEIAADGISAVLEFLAECRRGSSHQWESKMLVVGQGGVGKTSTIKSLIDEPFDPKESTTHGMRTFDYRVPHPERPGTRMYLRTWDFGGQEIYHATHQFFLTDRSLFLLLWNNRLGWDQGRLRYWLDIIAARAPKSPVVLVATNAPPEGRPVDLPYDDLRGEYPQIVASVAIDNETGDGIDKLRGSIADTAANLPLMGIEWPTTWLNAANAVQALPDKHVTPARLWLTMRESGLANTQHQRFIASALHALGAILFHMDVRELRDTVILRPEWVNSYISRVLDSPEVEHCHGLLSRGHLDALWEDLDRGMRDHFLGMMEEYDLSYKTDGEHGDDLSLVVERLPWSAPAAYQEQWDRVAPGAEEHEVRVHYQLNTTPPGIPTWFIARSHRFTTDTHWRTGAVLAHPDGRHRALIRADQHRNTVELAVRGPSPATFFAVLDDGLNLTLGRYPGLHVKRLVPCQCSPGCTELFAYEDLQRRLERTPPRLDIECHRTGESVHVPLLLLGLPPSEREEIRGALARLEKQGTNVLERLEEHAGDGQRMFLKLQQQVQEGLETRCPSVFTVAELHGGRVRGARFELSLYCEEPGSWHPLPGGAGVYQFSESPLWLRRIGPYLRELLLVLKHVAPLAGPILGVTVEHLNDRRKADIELFSALVEDLPEQFVITAGDGPNVGDAPMERASSEADFRELEAKLVELDPTRRWGGLSRIATPEGLTLYLCPEHAAPYLNHRRRVAGRSLLPPPR